MRNLENFTQKCLHKLNNYYATQILNTKGIDSTRTFKATVGSDKYDMTLKTEQAYVYREKRRRKPELAVEAV